MESFRDRDRSDFDELDEALDALESALWSLLQGGRSSSPVSRAFERILFLIVFLAKENKNTDTRRLYLIIPGMARVE